MTGRLEEKSGQSDGQSAVDFREVVEQDTGAVVVYDSAFRYVYLNPVAEDLLQRPLSDLAGKKAWEEFPEAVGLPTYDAQVKAMRERVPVTFTADYAPLGLAFEASCQPIGGPKGGLIVRWRENGAQKRTEQDLQKSEERYRSLVEATSQIVWTNAPDGTMRGPQEGWCGYTGQTEAEAQGYGWAKAVHPDDAQPTVEAWEKAVRTRSLFLWEHRVRNREGQYRTFAIRGVPILNEDNTIREWVGVHSDITGRKERERSHQFLADLAEKTRFILDPDALTWEVVRLVGEHLSVSRYMYADVDTDAQTVTVNRDFHQNGVQSIAGTWPLAPWGRRVLDDLAAGRTVVNTDYATDPRTAGEYEAIYKQAGIRASVTVPLFRDGQWVAVFSAQTSDAPRTWTPDEVSLLETVAQRMWLALENARLHKAQQEAAHRQRAFIREMLFSLTEGRLCLCDTSRDLPAPLAESCGTVELTRRSLRTLRHEAITAAQSAGLPDERLQDLTTAVGEAAMNAVVHAGGGEGEVYLNKERGTVQAWVRDTGGGIKDDAIHRATLERGFTTAGSLGHGFWLMLKTCDRVYLLTGPDGTTVVLEQERTPPLPSWLQVADETITRH